MRQPSYVWFLLVLLLPLGGCHRGRPGLTVSAASDLADAFSEIGQQFTAETGIEVSFNFGSTGQLAQQIEQGAPVDLFAAASLSHIEGLEKKGLLRAESRRVYGVGRLVIWTRRDNLTDIKSVSDLRQPGIRRIAIANPEHAPYGIAAREALQSAGLWSDLAPHLVLAGNVREALHYAESGEVDVALVARSLCHPSGGEAGGRWWLVPADLHQPLIQAMGIVSSSPKQLAAEKFCEAVTSDNGKKILGRYGFAVPAVGVEE